MILSTVPVFKSDLFYWTHGSQLGGKGVADASDLSRGGSMVFYTQVYDDACDVGFYIENTNNGSKKLFTHMKDVKGPSDDELMCQVFRSVDPEDPIKVVVYND
jgi:hypothetical protein